jgi:hypothetical protein
MTLFLFFEGGARAAVGTSQVAQPWPAQLVSGYASRKQTEAGLGRVPAKSGLGRSEGADSGVRAAGIRVTTGRPDEPSLTRKTAGRPGNDTDTIDTARPSPAWPGLGDDPDDATGRPGRARPGPGHRRHSEPS